MNINIKILLRDESNVDTYVCMVKMKEIKEVIKKSLSKPYMQQVSWKLYFYVYLSLKNI